MGSGTGKKRRVASRVGGGGPFGVPLRPLPVFTRVIDDVGRGGEIRMGELRGGKGLPLYGVKWDDGGEPHHLEADKVHADPGARKLSEAGEEWDRNLLGRIVSVDAATVTKSIRKAAGIAETEGVRLPAQVVQVVPEVNTSDELRRSNNCLEFGLYLYENGGVYSFGHRLRDVERVAQGAEVEDVAPVSF